MSLTILLHDRLPVEMVRWFLEPNGLVLYASGPVVEIPLADFRKTGFDRIRAHFEEYFRVRVPESKLQRVFAPGEARKHFKNRRVLEISIHPEKNLILCPMVVEKYSLGDLRRVRPLIERVIPLTISKDMFWKVFDDVVVNAPQTT